MVMLASNAPCPIAVCWLMPPPCVVGPLQYSCPCEWGQDLSDPGSKPVFVFPVLVGVGYGCAYTPPIQVLIDWFPDKRGLASGIVISGFGSGALFFAPMMNIFTKSFSTIPTFLGSQVRNLDLPLASVWLQKLILRKPESRLYIVKMSVDHSTLEAPVPILAVKLSNIGSG